MVEGFQHTEIGTIPNDWNVKTLGEVGEVRMCRRVFNHETKEQGEIPFFKIGTFGKEPDAYISKKLYDNYRQRFSFPKKGDILISAAGTIGRTLIYDGSPSYYQDSNIVWIENNETLIPNEFLFHVLQVVKYSTEGGTIQRLYNNILRNTKFSCPPTKAEQTAIATALNDADALIQKLEQLIAKKRNIKTGAMQELLKPKEGWEEKTLHELADNKKELFDDGDWIEAEHITDNGIRIIQTGNIGVGCYVEKENKKYIFEDSFYKLKCKQLIEGDLLICRLAEPAGRACVLPNIGESRIVTSVDVTIFRPRPEVANRVFLANLFSTSDWFSKVIERVGGTTHKRISRSSLGKISISMPKIDVQNHIATILLDMDNEINELEKQLEKYKMMKQGMMQSLLTGKIRLV